MSDVSLSKPMTAEQRMATIRFHESKIEERKSEIRKLKSSCCHEFPRFNSTDDSAICVGCGSDFGWLCPESRDGLCHYHSIDGVVVMLNGEEIKVAEGHDADNESNEWCIFCGNPEERL